MFKLRHTLLIGLIPTVQVHATMPVVDWSAIFQMTKQLKEMQRQYQVLNSTYRNTTQQLQNGQSILNNAKSQLQSTKDLINKNSGHYGFGNLKNGIDDLKNQQWSADSWADALKGKTKNNSVQYSQLLKSYQSNHKTLSQDDFQKGASIETAKSYQHSVEVNQAAGVQSAYAFNEVNKSLERIHQLSQKIEKADNTKAAVDLNSRLLTEVAYLQTQNLKAQSLINQQLAQKQSLELSERAKASQYLAFDDEY